MSEANQKNCVVWVDVPVVDLDRAVNFYSTVLNTKLKKEKYEDFEFAVFDHDEGNGACLVVKPASEIGATQGLSVYFNVNNRLDDAVNKVVEHGGVILEPAHPIGEYGARAVVSDSEGNRIVLHSA